MIPLEGYYELEPEDNHFTDVTADVTHKCNMACGNCYIPNRDIPDMDTDKLIECISKFPKKTMIRIMGAEPTMREDLPDVIRRIRQSGHRCTLLTNGLRLASNRYVQRLKDVKLSHIYISLNGVDNDDWYEKIDELRCAKTKMLAVDNIARNKFIVDTGTIIVKGINDEAPGRLVSVLKNKGIDNALLRIKNVGQYGDHMVDSNNNYSLNDLIELCADQFGISVDYINSFRDHPIYGEYVETDTFIFPIDASSKGKWMHRSGYWVKITDWDSDHGNKPYPWMGQKRRGRITEDFKIAPLSAHLVANLGGY